MIVEPKTEAEIIAMIDRELDILNQDLEKQLAFMPSFFRKDVLEWIKNKMRRSYLVGQAVCMREVAQGLQARYAESQMAAEPKVIH